MSTSSYAAWLAAVADLVESVVGAPADRVRLQDGFVDDLTVDSLAMLEVLEGCRVRFGVEVDDEATRQLVHVGDLVDYLAHHAAPEGPGR